MHKYISKFLVVSLLCCALNQNTIAQVTKFDTKFIPATVYTVKNGLTSNNIQDIVQDQQGFLWLATQNGLSRFDSMEFTNYFRNKADEFSLPDVLVEQVVLMPDNKLWLSINNVGITVFDKFSEKFTSAKNSDSALFQIPSSNLFGISKDTADNVWFSIYGDGVYQWREKNQEFIEHSQRNKTPWLTSNENYELLVDSQNRLWVCTIDSKVYLFDIDTNNAKYFNFATDKNNPASSPIYFFTESVNGVIYAAGYSGVFKYNDQSQLFDTVISEKSMTDFFGGQHASVKTMLADSKGNLWIGTTSGLLLYSDEVLNSVKLYENGEVVEADWTSNSIIEGYAGNIWIGTEGAGLFKLAPDWDRYVIYISNDKETIDIRGSYLYKDNIWVIHPSSRIDLLKLENDSLVLKKTLYPNFENDVIRIDDFRQYNDDYFWVSAINGIHRVNAETGEIKAVTDSEGKNLGVIKRFIKGKNNMFYYNSFNDKAIGFFEETNMIGQIIQNSKDNSLKGNNVKQMLNGLDDNIWLATSHGIEMLDITTHKYRVLYSSATQNDVSWIYFSKDDNVVWAIVEGALKEFLWQDNRLLAVNNKFNNILPLYLFSSIHKLKKDVILLTTKDSGLVELNTVTLDYKIYNKGNGLPSNETANILFPQQTPLIVTSAGVALYNKNYTDNAPIKPKFIIDNLQLGDNKLEINQNQNLVLENNYGSLIFNMALLAYTDKSSVEFEYKLSGNNENWVSTGNDGQYRFLNLSGGDYIFHARGRSNYGQWSDEQQFSFSVKPPLWNSLWAYVFYALFSFAFLYWIFYLYKRKLLYENEIIKEQTQKQLATQASKAKSDFLARVSHEVRTPLNGVLGMSELMLDTSLDEEQKIYTDTIVASGNHLLDIINDILDLSKIESGNLELELHDFDLLELIDEVVVSFTSQSQQKQLLFTCEFDEKLARNRTGDIIRIKQILFNLLSNAFKFTKHGEIKLSVCSSVNHNDGIVITVEDTGIGINNETVEDLFKPFIQADTATTRKYGGTGLGLAIVKQLVDKMQGTIKAHGKATGGSIFTIELPLTLGKQVALQESTRDKILENINIAMSMQNLSLESSIKHYSSILGVEIVVEINNSCQCLFVDAITPLTVEQTQQITSAEECKIPVHFIAFNADNLSKNICKNISLWQVFSPPITFKKLQILCSDTIEKQKVQELPSYKTASLSLKILVVEDNIINQQVSIEMLERMGHIVDIVDNAEEALVMLYRNDYDLLLSDYHLPGMDGIKLIKNWSNPKDIPVIMVTADLTDAVIQQCEKLGINNIVAKPFSQQALFSAIEIALDN